MAKTPTKPPEQPILKDCDDDRRLAIGHQQLFDLFEQTHGPQALAFALQLRVMELTMLSDNDDAQAAELALEYQQRLVSTRHELG